MRESLFDQSIPDETRDAWAEILAAPPAPEPAGGLSFFVFRCGGRWYGLEARVLDEVLVPGPVRPLPHHRNDVIHGVTNVRGRITLCVRLEALLGLPPAAEKDPRLAVLRLGSWSVAAQVTEVGGVDTIDPGALEPSGNDSATAPPVVLGQLPWRDQRVAWIDEERLAESLREATR